MKMMIGGKRAANVDGGASQGWQRARGWGEATREKRGEEQRSDETLREKKKRGESRRVKGYTLNKKAKRGGKIEGGPQDGKVLPEERTSHRVAEGRGTTAVAADGKRVGQRAN